MRKTVKLAQIIFVSGICAALTSCEMTVVEPPSLTLEEEPESDPGDPRSWGSGEAVMEDGTVPGYNPPAAEEKRAPDPGSPSSWSDDNTFDVQDEMEFRRAQAKARETYTVKETETQPYAGPYDYSSPDHRSILWRLKNFRLRKAESGGMAAEDPPCLR